MSGMNEIGGTAVLLVVGGCAIIAAAAVVGTLWVTYQAVRLAAKGAVAAYRAYARSSADRHAAGEAMRSANSLESMTARLDSQAACYTEKAALDRPESAVEALHALESLGDLSKAVEQCTALASHHLSRLPDPRVFTLVHDERAVSTSAPTPQRSARVIRVPGGPPSEPAVRATGAMASPSSAAGPGPAADRVTSVGDAISPRRTNGQAVSSHPRLQLGGILAPTSRSVANAPEAGPTDDAAQMFSLLLQTGTTLEFPLDPTLVNSIVASTPTKPSGFARFEAHIGQQVAEARSLQQRVTRDRRLALDLAAHLTVADRIDPDGAGGSPGLLTELTTVHAERSLLGDDLKNRVTERISRALNQLSDKDLPAECGHGHLSIRTQYLPLEGVVTIITPVAERPLSPEEERRLDTEACAVAEAMSDRWASVGLDIAVRREAGIGTHSPPMRRRVTPRHQLRPTSAQSPKKEPLMAPRPKETER